MVRDGNETGPGRTPTDETGIILTPEQKKSRRHRNLAIGLAVGFFVLLFYVVTMAKLAKFGVAALPRPL